MIPTFLVLNTAAHYRRVGGKATKDPLSILKESGIMRKGSIMNEKLKYAYDKMNRCCVSGQSLFSAVGSDMEYEEWFRIMLDGFEEGRDYTTVVVPAKPALNRALPRQILQCVRYIFRFVKRV